MMLWLKPANDKSENEIQMSIVQIVLAAGFSQLLMKIQI